MMNDILYNEVSGYVKNETWKTIAIHDENNVKGFFGEYRFLSNMEPIKISYDGDEYHSVENAYQAAKIQQKEKKDAFINCTPIQSKRLAKNIILPEGWHKRKYSIMYELTLKKYRDINLREKLLATGDKHLEETNYWHDTYWGVCDGVGKNKLGEILMMVRDFYSEDLKC